MIVAPEELKLRPKTSAERYELDIWRRTGRRRSADDLRIGLPELLPAESLIRRKHEDRDRTWSRETG